MGRCHQVNGGSDRQEYAYAVAPSATSTSARAQADSAWPARLSRVAAIALPLLLAGLLSWPLLFTNATFNEDWLNHFWYLWHQSLAIRATHLPSLFLSYSQGVFYPLYGFYGGTLYALAGALSLALGDAPLQAYILTYLLGFAAAYAGWYWLARSFGLSGWTAHMPGLVFVTSSSYLTLVYGAGDWPEFIAVSSMPPLIASGIDVLRTPHLRTRSGLALAASSILFFGSHLLTLLWGTTFLAIATAAILVGVPAARQSVTRAGLLRVAGIVVPALLVSAWFLLPTLAYESQTVIAASYPHFRKLLQTTIFIVAARNLFTLSRAQVSGAIVTVALPVLAMAWTLGSVALSLRARRGRIWRETWMRVFWVLTGISVLIGVVMTHAQIVLALPRPYATLQFGFRLESYLLLSLSGLLLTALVLARADGPRRTAPAVWHWLLVPLAAVSLIGALEQVGGYRPSHNRSVAVRSYLNPIFEQEGLLDYVDDDLRIWHGQSLMHVNFALDAIERGSASVIVHARRDQLIDTNLRSPPAFVEVRGARIAGTDTRADDVLEVTPPRSAGAAPRTTTISVAPAATGPFLLGRILSGLGLLALTLQLLRSAAGDIRRRTRAKYDG